MELSPDTRSWDEVARRLWLKPTPVRKVRPEVLEAEIWNPLEAESFSLQSLALLEGLQILEKFLWPAYNEDASHHHVLLIAIFVNIKEKSHLTIWDIFTDRQDDFSSLFHRVLSMNLDKTVATALKLHLIAFVISAFQSLENGLVRKECAPLVSIAMWHNLQNETERVKLLDKASVLRKAWRASQKRYEVADEPHQALMLFERSWLYSMLLDFLRRLNDTSSGGADNLSYCERFLEFLVDLVSQLPTRRYSNTLLKDLNLIPVIRLSKLFKDENNALFRDLSFLLRHFVAFAIDDHVGQQFSTRANHEAHCQALARLQRESLKHFEKKLKVLALSNYASIDKRVELESHFSTLSVLELEELCSLLGFRTSYPKQTGIVPDREFYLETLIAAFERRRDFHDTVNQLSILPTEGTIYEPALLRNETYDGSRPLAIPKLNLQYLSLGDFLWRSFILHRSEAFFEIRKDMESVVKRMQPRSGKERNSTLFDGFSKMAIPIAKPAIIEVAQPKIGSTAPAFVRAEIILDVSRLNDSIRAEWDSLRQDDVVFLLCVKTGRSPPHLLANGHSDQRNKQDWELAHVRAAEIVDVLDDNGRSLRHTQTGDVNGFVHRGRQRRLLVNIDSNAYQADKEHIAQGKVDIYPMMNVLVRRRGRENNFKSVLETIKGLTVAETQLPSWFQDVFLGYGDPNGARYQNLPDKIESLDFRDTFLDWQHLNHSFPGKSIKPSSGQGTDFGPPYVLRTFSKEAEPPLSNPKKRRRDQMETNGTAVEAIGVSTYKASNTGPYPMDAPRINTIRFTPAQVTAIMSGTQPGLSVIVGPPGTGKTDVVTQIINLLYHNFPQQRILLLAHSNQALNQLFQKIIALDIDARHLLRLGHGEEGLETEASYSKYGRVESFLENRQAYLSEVDRLAGSIGAQGAHGSSCETADYFNKVYIQPAWSQFWDHARSSSATPESIVNAFPFHEYFSTAPSQPLLPLGSPLESLISTAAGCQHHTTRIFTELEAIRPFEILRHPRDRANHLLIKEARIIAMTSTHAAMRRSEIANLGFHYDTLIMEEAAQITEIESFIPCAMQNSHPKTGELPLKRVVLVGDHLQNSPVVQNMAFRQYANFEQSLFLRLVRLGVPTINLDQQGRCRPSIANLFKWRYHALGNLPHLAESPEFARANAGFRYEYQFIDVPDYQGQGEREPSPHFIQNLGEAEYAVALYQYMRLLGYPARSISILATYAGQRALIKDVLDHRCKSNRLFGLPRIVTTVDKYQGEQNDYIILSLTRTRSIGYLRDVRRLTVALSRARLGLYILGCRELFETCSQMEPAMNLLFAHNRPDKLVLTPSEMYPTNRLVSDEEGIAEAEMEGVEHLGQYVFEMAQARVNALGVGGQLSAPLVEPQAPRDGYLATALGAGGDDENVENGGMLLRADPDEDNEEEDDPLHESVGVL